MTLTIATLLVILVPPMLRTQTKAYDTVAQSCARALQTGLLTGDNPQSLKSLLEQDGVQAACDCPTLHVTPLAQPSTFAVQDSRGKRTFIVTPTALSNTP